MPYERVAIYDVTFDLPTPAGDLTLIVYVYLKYLLFYRHFTPNGVVFLNTISYKLVYT